MNGILLLIIFLNVGFFTFNYGISLKLVDNPPSERENSTKIEEILEVKI